MQLSDLPDFVVAYLTITTWITVKPRLAQPHFAAVSDLVSLFYLSFILESVAALKRNKVAFQLEAHQSRMYVGLF